MTLPKVRMTVNQRQRDLMHLGMEKLANGLATAKLGFFPYRHAYDRIDPQLASIHVDRSFDPEMAERIVTLRATLRAAAGSPKVRLDLFQISIAALALRISRAHAKTSSEAFDSEAFVAFGKKLEAYRMRANRLTVKTIGAVAYEETTRRWRLFNAWVRYNLLQFKFPKERRSFSRRQLWREQREKLGSMIQQALDENLHSRISDEQLDRMVSLVRASLRRGRQPMTLMEVVKNAREGRDLLFRFVNVRLELYALPGADVPPWKFAMQNADKIQAAQALRRQARASSPVLETGQRGAI